MGEADAAAGAEAEGVLAEGAAIGSEAGEQAASVMSATIALDSAAARLVLCCGMS
jgi:hypothetical protein